MKNYQRAAGMLLGLGLGGAGAYLIRAATLLKAGKEAWAADPGPDHLGYCKDVDIGAYYMGGAGAILLGTLICAMVIADYIEERRQKAENLRVTNPVDPAQNAVVEVPST